ncbi:phage tail tape measure protein [Streptomyces sp. SID8016]|uniref:phage tail tape measure protein n=1 Tax=Streptomyces sp. SID8016 TaxID=2706098 RepID=UPI0013D9BFB4|nr:phage tail tape measure protein [Streptomyces sp. SID8016]
MALTVGELVGFIRLDDGEVRPALRRTEGDLTASGRRMADDAEQAGQQAGQALGDGFTRAADGSIRDARGRFVSAARRSGDAAGDALGDALRDGARDGADDAVQAAEGGLSRLQTIAAGAGVAAGAALMVGITDYLEQSQILGTLEGQIGGTPAVAQKYGKAAGRLFASAMVEDFQTAADTMAAIAQNGLIPTGATERQLDALGVRIATTGKILGEEVAHVSTTVGKMVKTGMARDAEEAMDILVKAQQKGLNASEDLLDTFDEYSTQFRKVGIDGPMAMGLVSQALAGGARDTDIAADAIKEFSLLSIDGSEAAAEAYKALGLDADKMIKILAAGGPKATKAMDTIFDKIRGLDDPVKKNTVAIGLFGTKFEDLGGAFDTMDPSKAAAKFGTFSGAVDKAGNSIQESAGVRVEAFKRGVTQGIVNVLGTQVIPALMRFGQWAQKNGVTLRIVAGVVAGVLVPALVLMGVAATVRGAQVVAGWVMSGVAALRSAGTQIAAAARVVGAWLLMAARAVLNGARVAAGWLMAGAGAAASAAGQVAAGARVVGAWLLMGVQSLLQGARMAAAWVIAMGPVGWVIAAIVGLGVLIWKNWDKIVKWTTQAWGWIWDKIKGIGAAIVGFFVRWNLVSIFLRHWDRIKAGATTKAGQLVMWVSRLPGRISASLGSLGSLLLEKGRNVVQGLWSGIQAMGGWIKSKIMGWARSVIPGPIAKALGIASPSKVTKAQGRWIARGLVDGLTGSAKQVRAAAAKLADIVTDSLRPGKTRSKALGRISSDSKKLVKLATREAVVAARLKTAQKKLADQIKARDTLAADVRKGVLEAGNITADGGPTSADQIIQTLDAQASRARTFEAHLAALRKKGLRADLISQIAQAGVEQGASAAAALATASQAQIKQANANQAALVRAAGNAGATAGDAMYGAGIQAGQGLVRGLQREQAAIERQMLKIATGMQRAIRRALGIKSPSRVMAAIGKYIPRGLVAGIDGERGLVDRSMAGLVDPDAVITPAGAGSYGGGFSSGSRGSSAPTVIEIRSDGSRRSDWLVEELRSSVQAKGGDVQLVLGGRR